MQENGKRLLLAVALALGFMLIWTKIFQKDEPKPTPDTAGSAEGSAAAATPPSPNGNVVVEPPMQRGPEKTITLTFPNVTATFSSYGGVLSGWKLADDRYERDTTKGQLLPEIADTGAFNVNFARSTHVLPSKTEWVGEQTSPTSVKYTLKTAELEMVKELTVDPANYLVKMVLTTKVLATGDAQQNLAVSVFAVQDPKNIKKGTSQEGPRAWHSSSLVGDEIHHSSVGAVTKAPRQMDNITWTGFEHPYLLAAYSPNRDAGQKVLKRTYIEGDPATGLMRTDMFFGTRTLKSGEVYTREVVGYLGPKFFTTLRDADEVAGFPTQFQATVDLGWFAFIGKPLLWLLLKFYAFLGNWGLAIMLLTFLVKGATLYWTTASMRSMKAMAALAPQMKVLQEKYKNDRQRLNVEMQALYKLHKVNPIAGCLPILLQMPIWLALYRMLSAAGELYQQPFIPGWIDDLTASDPFYILPIVLVVTMFLQARLTPQTGDSTQQKIMQYGLPLGFGVMAFMFPAGLTLYIFTNTVLSALHSIYMNKYDKKSKEIVARMAATTAAADDKGKSPAKGEKKVIDVADAADDSDDQDGSGDSARAGSSGPSNPARNRPKKKKRRK